MWVCFEDACGMVKKMVCFMCGKFQMVKLTLFIEVLDRESGGLKSVVDYYLCKSCYAVMKKGSI